MTAIEAVARAICVAAHVDPEPTLYQRKDKVWTKFIPQAKAALLAAADWFEPPDDDSANLPNSVVATLRKIAEGR